MDQVLLSIETPNAPPMTYVVPAGGEISIGRDETCTVVLASPDISRRHVTVMIQSTAIVVRDSSSNGTQVGAQRVFRSELPVPFGTPIQVGPYVIRVVRQGGAPCGMEWHPCLHIGGCQVVQGSKEHPQRVCLGFVPAKAAGICFVVHNF